MIEIFATKTEKGNMKIIKREKSTSTKGHYVTNAVLLPAVLEAKELNVVTDKLIKMIQMIAERYSRKSNFVNYSFREDMVAAATLNLCNNALKFNPEKSNNPFSFYTTAIHNSFLQYIYEEKKHRQIRDQLLIDAGSNPSFNYQEKSITDSDTMTYNFDVLDEVEEAPAKKKIAVEGGVPVDAAEAVEGIFCVKDGEEEKIVPKKKEVPYRLQHKEPTGGVVYAASEMVYDEALGYFVKKPVEEPVKKTRRKKAA
jgi:hypothetical protein